MSMNEIRAIEEYLKARTSDQCTICGDESSWKRSFRNEYQIAFDTTYYLCDRHSSSYLSCKKILKISGY